MDTSATVHKFTRRAAAIAILDYANANQKRQAEMRRGAREVISEILEELPKHFSPDPNAHDEYADIERESRMNISNHELTEDQRLDDPRHGEFH